MSCNVLSWWAVICCEVMRCNGMRSMSLWCDAAGCDVTLCGSKWLCGVNWRMIWWSVRSTPHCTVPQSTTPLLLCATQYCSSTLYATSTALVLILHCKVPLQYSSSLDFSPISCCPSPSFCSFWEPSAWEAVSGRMLSLVRVVAKAGTNSSCITNSDWRLISGRHQRRRHTKHDSKALESTHWNSTISETSSINSQQLHPVESGAGQETIRKLLHVQAHVPFINDEAQLATIRQSTIVLRRSVKPSYHFQENNQREASFARKSKQTSLANKYLSGNQMPTDAVRPFLSVVMSVGDVSPPSSPFLVLNRPDSAIRNLFSTCKIAWVGQS